MLSDRKFVAALRARRAGLATALFVGTDVAACVVSVLFGCTVSAALGPLGAGATGWLLPAAAASCAFVVASLAARGHYDRRVPAGREWKDVCSAAGLALIAGAASAFLFDIALPRSPLLCTAALLPVTLFGLRRAARSALDQAGLWRLPVVVVGSGAWARRAAAVIRTDIALGYEIAGVAEIPGRLDRVVGDVWTRLMRRHDAQLLVLAYSDDCRLPATLVASLVRERVPFSIMTEPNGLPVVGAETARLGGDDFIISYRNNLRRPVARALKAAFDVAAAMAALVVLAPVFGLIAFAVRSDGGPALFAHKRIGARGQVFGCLKFRSMVVDSEAALLRHLAENPEAAEEWARTHKLRCDPRITGIGRFLRKTSLDELPQLLNVLRLDMSLVGPRPIVSLEIGKYAEDIAYYYEARPGITGLWQVSGRSDTSYAHRVQLDSWYVKNWTMWLDFTILARTLPAVVSGRGAG
jgi:undecaprenyl-phosphate galactose phosphotransferase